VKAASTKLEFIGEMRDATIERIVEIQAPVVILGLLRSGHNNLRLLTLALESGHQQMSICCAKQFRTREIRRLLAFLPRLSD